MRIIKDGTAVVVIDIQERLLPHIFQWELTLQNCLKLIDGLQVLSVPMLVTQQYTKGLGNTEPSVVNKITGFSHIEKNTFSCCGEPLFMERFASLEKKYIILCGIETHVCVLQTCLDLIESGFIPVVVEDCVSSRKPNDKEIAIERMRQEGARITTLESILFELTQVSGTETFKSISKLVK
ncbi:MAG: isochorismatase family protein [Bacteroidetes bacterium]|nr:isochorismatase family protein [Bacteroidota bacterium]